MHTQGEHVSSMQNEPRLGLKLGFFLLQGNSANYCCSVWPPNITGCMGKKWNISLPYFLKVKSLLLPSFLIPSFSYPFLPFLFFLRFLYFVLHSILPFILYPFLPFQSFLSCIPSILLFVFPCFLHPHVLPFVYSLILILMCFLPCHSIELRLHLSPQNKQCFWMSSVSRFYL